MVLVKRHPLKRETTTADRAVPMGGTGTETWRCASVPKVAEFIPNPYNRPSLAGTGGEVCVPPHEVL